MSEEWCDLCDLPKATCVHGMPPAPKPEPKPAPAPRARRASAQPSTKAAGASKPAGVVVRRTARRQTPPASFRPHILAVLREHGGAWETEPLQDAVHERMAAVLLDSDEEVVGAGDVRWRLAMRRERAELTRDGLMLPARQPGLWELAPEGLTP